MKSLIISSIEWLQRPEWTAVFLDVFLKSMVILALAGLACALLRRSAASGRHLVWLLAVLAVLCLPMIPNPPLQWDRPLWSVATRGEPENEISLTLEFGLDAARMNRETEARQPAEMVAPSDSSPARKPSVSARVGAHWVAAGFTAWMLGAIGYLLWIAIGHLRLGVLRRAARPADERSMTLLGEACRRFGIRRKIRLLQSDRELMPMTWGWFRPSILLPARAREWPEERLRAVLLHEAGHVFRWDCLTQGMVQLACAFYWCNPLIWYAARRMNVERERACDDLVLNDGCRASDYAGHLLEIALSFRRAPRSPAAIAMARSSRLEDRISAIIDSSRARRFSHFPLAGSLALGMLLVISALAAPRASDGNLKPAGKPWFEERLRAFFKVKERQARSLAGAENASSGVWRYFEAGAKGDWTTATNLWPRLKARADKGKDSSLWQVRDPMVETFLAFEAFSGWREKYVMAFGNDIINSIPPGAIFFGGTAPGRGVITALSESHVQGKPFYTLTQNGLADGMYLDYLRQMYGQALYIPTVDDSRRAFEEYLSGAQQRLQSGKLRPGEDVRVVENKVTVSGRVAVMEINALIAKTIFDQNPNHEFYIEESFPLEWMYPYLSPSGLIMKINREPLPTLSDEIARKDREYWSRYIKPMIGDWLNDKTSLAEVAGFAERVYLKRNLRGFEGDPQFIADTEAQKSFSKLRASMAGVYAWRAVNATSPGEKRRFEGEADFAFRQAFALCPVNPEALERYGELLTAQKRKEDLQILAGTVLKFDPKNRKAIDLKERSNED